MKRIKVTAIETRGQKLKISYQISTKLEKYFSELRAFEAEYSENISDVPPGVLVIPFVCNVLPIVWLTDAILELPVLDREFYEAIPNVQEGYRNMSPMLSFKGSINVDKIEKNTYQPTENTAAFFSGGVDAFATLVAHVKEKPQLITLWGADIKLNDIEGWDRVKSHIKTVSQQFGLVEPLMVRSNFRTIVIEKALNELVKSSKETWWYGYQHGIGIIGHAAPIAYHKRWKTVYFASTNTISDKVICASDPTIDNKVKFVNTKIWHDQYEFTRQQKVQHIVESCKNGGPPIQLRVCWQSDGGSNCCHCEKCARTLFAILAEGENPRDFGFANWQKYISIYPTMLRMQLYEVEHLRAFWADIQHRMLSTQPNYLNQNFRWLYALDVNNPLTYLMKLKLEIKRTLPFIWRILRHIKEKLSFKNCHIVTK
ncbi:MAG: hypothetical protein Q4F38_01795 [Akkermansia sp.]|nr:hypothetical protein [Akkermansia sp.]